ncbi:MAG: hypothetical protein WBF93_05685, partial [Pirellulales bacterium]
STHGKQKVCADAKVSHIGKFIVPDSRRRACEIAVRKGKRRTEEVEVKAGEVSVGDLRLEAVGKASFIPR